MRWLGLDWDEGPVLQSGRFDSYLAAADRLLAEGKAYECFCTEAEVRARNEDAMREGRTPGYDGRCRGLSAAEQAAFVAEGRARSIRFRTPDEGRSTFEDVIRGEVAVEWSTIPDFVIVRSNGTPVFFLANAVDDVDMSITHVLRGEDLIDSTHRVLALRRALGHDDQPVYAHLPLILGQGGGKLSKRHAAISVEEYRDAGYLPGALCNYLALLGWGPEDGREVLTVDELVAEFDLGRVIPSAATFDPKKLEWMNAEHIRRLTSAELQAAVLPFARALRRPARYPALRGGSRARAGAGDHARADHRPDGVPLHSRRGARDRARVMGEAREGRAGTRDPRRGHRTPGDVRVGGRRHQSQGTDRGPRREGGEGDARRLHGGRRARVRPSGIRLDLPARSGVGVAAVARRSRQAVRRVLKIALRVVLALFAVLFVYLAVVFVQVWLASRRDDARRSDAIVVLGAAQFDGRPSKVLAARLDHAIDLFRRDIAPIVVVTGGKQTGDRFTEAGASATYLHDRDVPERAILRETTGRSSWQSLASAARILKERKLTRVVLVSDPYHAARIDDIANEVGLHAVTSPTRTSPIAGVGVWRRIFTETIRVAAGRLFGYGRLDRHRDVEKLVPGLATLCAPPLRVRRRGGTIHSGVV